MGTIRLACLLCDEDRFDGIDAIPADWRDVDEVQSYEAATAEVDFERECASGWWTHLGICPDCQQQRFASAEPGSAAP